MNQTIRERGQKVFQAGKGKLLQGIEAIASVTGISKSSVHRHQQGIERRNQYPESEWWETEAGSAWLKRLVFGSIFFFGIKHGIGAGELSQFLKALHLELHVGCSPSALDQLKQRLKDTIEAYEAAQAEHCQPQSGQGIGVGADEVFFGLPVLVLAELGSGYLLTEVQAEDRSYETWKEQIQSWWSQAGWQCHFLVSDRAKALIKLATDGLGCVSVADLFHALRAVGHPIGSALGRQQAQLVKQMNTLKAKWESAQDDANRLKLSQALSELSTQAALSCSHHRHHSQSASLYP
jgi:outer membrane murein-binding lipoprotein Lpp